MSARHWDEGGRQVSLDVGNDEFVVAAHTFGRHPFLFLYDPRPIRRMLRQKTFDVIDVHEEPASLAAAELRLLHRLYGGSARVLLYSAENLFKKYPFPFRWLERLALARTDGVYVCNHEAGQILREKGFRGVVRYLGLGVDVDHFSPVDQPSWSSGGLHAGYVGRLDERKGVQVILDAMAPELSITLEVVGGGSHREALERQSVGLGIGSRVRFSGHASYDELPAVYRRLDVLVVPSLPTRKWTEQFCRVAVEAMASGVPVVASRTGALPEVVGGGGIVVPPGDVDALRVALRSLAADPVMRARLAEKARAQAQQFSWSAIAEAHLQLYLDVAR